MAAIASNRMSQHSHGASIKTMLFLIALILLVGFMALAGFHPTTTSSPPFTTSTSLMMTDQRKHAIRASAPPTPSFLKKTRGSSWELWDGHSVLYNDLNFAPCRWTQFYVPGEEASSHITSLPMCVHPEADIISDAIAAGGRWQDCPYLGSVWHSLEQQDNQQHQQPQSRPKVHLEVGANIGACVLDVLLTTNAHIVAFEPNPRNLFRLTSTLSAVLAVYPHFESRIQLYPLGLGDTAKKDLIFGAARNFGHSTIGHGVKEYPGQQFDKGLPIYIERLDDLINCKHNDPQVEFSVMKLDAQGFECRIVQGASRVLSKVQIIPFEFTNHLLGAFHCKPQELWDMLTHAGFDIYTRDTYTQIPSNPIREDESSPQQLELLAARSGFQEKLLRAKHEEFSGELVQ